MSEPESRAAGAEVTPARPEADPARRRGLTPAAARIDPGGGGV